jgi:dihydroorotate dehydrogenase (NAD+) catalytic subunit
MAVGASAVQVGTASFIRPRAALDVLEEMETLLAARGVKRIGDWIGSLSGEPALMKAEARA